MNYKCKECGECVAKTDKEEHEAEAHAILKCQYCQFEALKSKFGNHEEKCEMKPKPCEFCEQIFRIEKLVDHVEKCGTKTKKCDQCQNYIQLRNWQNHLT